MTENEKQNVPEQLREVPGALAKEIGTDLLHNALAFIVVLSCVALPMAIGYLVAGDSGLVVGLLAGLVVAPILGVMVAQRIRARLRSPVRPGDL